MASVKSGCVILSFLILAVVSSSYGQAKNENARKTVHVAARTLPKAYFPTKYGHSFGRPFTFPSINKPSVSISPDPTIRVSVSKLVPKLRHDKLSALLESKPSPYPQRSGNPIVSYFPFFPLPPPPSLHHPKPNQPPKHHKPHNSLSTRNPVVPYYPFLTPPPPPHQPGLPPIRCHPRKPPTSQDPKIPYFPFCYLPLPPPQQLPNQPPKHQKVHKPPISGNPTIPYHPFFTPPPPHLH